MKSRKLFLVLRAILFLIVLSSLLFVFQYLMQPRTNNDSTIENFYSQSKNSIDVILIGNSSINKFWSPMQAYNDSGFTSYNFTSSSNSAWLYKYEVLEALKTQTPRLIIIDARAFLSDVLDDEVKLFNFESAARNVIDYIHQSQNKKDMIDATFRYMETSNIIEYYLPFIKYHDNVRDLLVNLKRLVVPEDASTFPVKGFFVKNLYAPVPLDDYSTVTDEKPLTANMLEVFNDFLSFCDEQQFEVLFVFSPFAQSEYPYYVERKNFVKNNLEVKGYNYFDSNDYYEDMDLSGETDFYDTAHVNIIGAEKFTNLFNNYLKANYNLPDHRSDAAYANWNDEYVKYKNMVEIAKDDILNLIKKHREEQ